MSKGVEAVPADPLVVRRVAGDRYAYTSERHTRLAAEHELAGQKQPGDRRPRHIDVDDPAFVRGVIVLLRAPPAAEAEVEQLIALDRRESNPATEALVAVIVLERVLGRLIFPA